MSEANKYSLWIVPKGSVGQQLKELITNLSEEYDTPDFVPHMTLVANILPNESEVADMRARCRELAGLTKPFAVTLTGYAYKDEQFRCLYLVAEAPELAGLYDAVARVFPQVATEHFADLPHISVLYGNFDAVTKKDIIATHAITPLTFTVDSLGLYLTNNPVDRWRRDSEYPLK
jgi:2'-5' RNA ligase